MFLVIGLDRNGCAQVRWALLMFRMRLRTGFWGWVPRLYFPGVRLFLQTHIFVRAAQAAPPTRAHPGVQRAVRPSLSPPVLIGRWCDPSTTGVGARGRTASLWVKRGAALQCPVTGTY